MAALVHAPISDSPHQVGRKDPRHATEAAICGETGSGSTPLPCGEIGPGGPLLCSDTGPAVRRSLAGRGCRDTIPPGSWALNGIIIPRMAVTVHISSLNFSKKAPGRTNLSTSEGLSSSQLVSCIPPATPSCTLELIT
jgi:hypothetical protein